MISFNKTNVSSFYDKLVVIMDNYKFPAIRIRNLDGTGVLTILNPVKIITAKGKHNTVSVTSGERGINATAIGAVSAATGSTIPVMFTFSCDVYISSEEVYFIANV